MSAPKMPTVENALHSLAPNCAWSVEYGATDEEWKLRWLDEEHPEPKRKDIEAEVKRLRRLWEAEGYRRLRRAEYPDVREQLDDLFHAGAFSPEMTARLQEVKDRYPKPRQRRGLRRRREG